jgi:hypothetical protein
LPGGCLLTVLDGGHRVSLLLVKTYLTMGYYG